MRFERIIVFFMVLSIFLDDFIFGADNRRGSTFDFYYYYLIFLSFLVYFLIRRKSMPWFPSWFFRFLLISFTLSVVAGSLSGKLGFPMLKQMIGITFSSIAYYNLYKFTNFDVKRLFGIYLTCSFYVALYGLGEEFLQLAGFNQYFDNVKRVTGGFYRVYSIMGEPYFLAVALIPAVYFYLNKMIGVKKFRDQKEIIRFGVITLCYLFTFSSAGFIGLAIMLALLAYNHKFFTVTSSKFFIMLLFVGILGPSLNLKELSITEIRVRIMDSFKAFGSSSTLDKDQIAKLNSSTFALYSNYLIAQKSFDENPLIGSGLGSHESTYNEYFESLFGKKFLEMYGMFNAKDGNSLFIRMMSETGIIGLVMLFYFVFKHFRGRKYLRTEELCYYTIINQGVFVVFIIRILRTGNYIGQGFFFFFFLYYITDKILLQSKKKKQLAQA